MQTPILGSAYVARTVNAADNRMINLFPEVLPEDSGGKTAAFLQRAPGLRSLATVGTGPIRGLHAYGDYMYVVSGSSLYKVDTSYHAVLLGAVANDGPVSMADNGIQLFVACNGPSFIYNNTTNAFAFNSLPSSPVEGMEYDITNGTIAGGLWGGVVTTGGASHCKVRYNGTNWTVAGK
jgi:hypothetical protein